MDDNTLLEAVLSMDVYNRDPSTGFWNSAFLAIFPRQKTIVGTISIIDVRSTIENTNDNFLAVAYEYPTQVVIS